jgi:hypothetical protein
VLGELSGSCHNYPYLLEHNTFDSHTSLVDESFIKGETKISGGLVLYDASEGREELDTKTFGKI